MSRPEPRYTPQNCQTAYQLNWSLSLFWKANPVATDTWLADLKLVTEKDGVRILTHRMKGEGTSQFFVSTKPDVSPSEIVRSVKGRLQHRIREHAPRALKGNYSIKSVGEANLAELEGYLDLQLERHPMADARVQASLERFQIDDPAIELSQPRRSTNGEFICNLHIVLVYDGRWREIREEKLARNRDVIVKTAAKKGHLLAKARILADHIHMMVGCGVTENPMEVVLAYMNNIAYAYEMRPVFQYGFFVGTFGEYDRGAIRRSL